MITQVSVDDPFLSFHEIILSLFFGACNDVSIFQNQDFY